LEILGDIMNYMGYGPTGDAGAYASGSKGIWEPSGFVRIEQHQAMGFSGGGGGGGMSFGGGRPQQLDTTRGDYGLPTIWSPEATIKESTDWARKIATSEPGNGFTQFDINTFSDPMAKRQGRGVYYMNPNETYASSPGHFRGAR
jgi:hypothetical protein